MQQLSGIEERKGSGAEHPEVWSPWIVVASILAVVFVVGAGLAFGSIADNASKAGQSVAQFDASMRRQAVVDANMQTAAADVCADVSSDKSIDGRRRSNECGFSAYICASTSGIISEIVGCMTGHLVDPGWIPNWTDRQFFQNYLPLKQYMQ